MKHQIGPLLILMVLVVACQSSTRPPSELRVGLSKAEVLELLGQPGVRGTLVKQTESIFGPQEEWWDQVEMGASLETWSYLYPGEGTQFVYFLDESDTVSFTAYTPEGVVY